MTNFQERIEQSLQGNGKIDPIGDFEDITFWMAKELSISPVDLMEFPIPLVLSLSENLSKYYKERAKAANKKR